MEEKSIFAYQIDLDIEPTWLKLVALVAFGFVVEKFALFLKKAAFFLRESNLDHGAHHQRAAEMPPSSGYSSTLGIILVALGALMALLAFIRYKSVEKQIDEDTYRPSLILDSLLTLSVLVIGIFLLIYLVHAL